VISGTIPTLVSGSGSGVERYRSCLRSYGRVELLGNPNRASGGWASLSAHLPFSRRESEPQPAMTGAAGPQAISSCGDVNYPRSSCNAACSVSIGMHRHAICPAHYAALIIRQDCAQSWSSPHTWNESAHVWWSVLVAKKTATMLAVLSLNAHFSCFYRRISLLWERPYGDIGCSRSLLAARKTWWMGLAGRFKSLEYLWCCTAASIALIVRVVSSFIKTKCWPSR